MSRGAWERMETISPETIPIVLGREDDDGPILNPCPEWWLMARPARPQYGPPGRWPCVLPPTVLNTEWKSRRSSTKYSPPA